MTWDASKHPRAAAGSAGGGQFAPLSYNAAKKTGSGYGSKTGDSNVKKLQQQLNRLGATDSKGNKLQVDGKLGPLTTSAVKRAQAALGLKQDGRVTPELLRRLTAAKSLGSNRKIVKAKVPARKAARKTREAADPKKPYGDVTYADPGYQDDGKKRYPLDTETHVRAAWSYINQEKNAAKYSAADLKKVKAKIAAAAKRLGIHTSEAVEQAVEAHVNGSMSFGDIKEAVRKALERRTVAETGKSYVYCMIADLTSTDVVYACGSDELMQCSYEISENGEVTLGDPQAVVRTYMPLPAATVAVGEEDYAEPEAAMEAVEDSDRLEGRVVEAKGTDDDGGRIFRVRIIAYGDSKNRRRYPESVMRQAAPMYEGSRAYDHHRTEAELRSSTINGLIGSYRNVEAEGDGLYGDLHLLPGATHAAEALDASLAQQKQGLPPLVGLSHDVMATYKPLVAGGRRMQEATAIVKVQSTDLVADPAAGGKATRMVAGGQEQEEQGTESGTVPAEMKEDEVPPTKEEILGALAEATDEELAGVGLTRIVESNDEEVEVEEETTEAVVEEYARDGAVGRLIIGQKVTEAKLPAAAVDALTKALPERITEADVDGQIAAMKAMVPELERAGLVPTASVQVTQEAVNKKIEALDAFFAGDYSKGYRSFKEAFVDFTGRRPKSFDEDFNRVVLRESLGVYDSQERATESADSSTWNLVLGDSITRRMVAEYNQPSLMTWQQVVSSVVPVNDFRTQRIDRLGGYGTLPTVNQGAPYQPLTTPGNEEVTYALTKRGGTEDITLEMIANDDVRAIAKIPTKLGLAASQTLFRFVWDFLRTNPNIYDGNAFFSSGSHSNDTSSAALNQSNLSLTRAAMRQQTAYGDTSDILSLVPKTLVVPSSLEEEAWQLVTSAVANPAPSGTQGSVGAADTPNIHQGMSLIVVDYFPGATGTPANNKWYVVADPNLCPTIELGFYQGRRDPELFTQNDPTVGSMFDADKVTYKIRHIYSGAVLDYRGFYRNGIP